MGVIAAAAIGAVGAVGAAYIGKQKAPGVAGYTPPDINQTTATAINANLQNFRGSSKLAAQTNQFNQSQASALLEQAIPGFGALQKRLLGQVNSDLDSQTSLPQDTQDKIAQYAAEKGVTRGTSGNFNGFSLVKDFGFNLIDWQNAKRTQALNTLSTVYGMSPRVNPMSPMSMFVSPDAALASQQANSQMQYQIAQGGLNASAAADNKNAGLFGSAFQAAAGFAQTYAKSNGVQSKAQLGNEGDN